ncbi:MAG TPA: hypothetical protein VD866_29630 [Urbifossiella sp.]|nr:hypothetical protein [Urbifossiella sp.]
MAPASRTTSRPRVERLEDRTAPAGDLDPTFGFAGTGRSVFPFDEDGFTRFDARDSAIQPDGRLVVVGIVRGASAGIGNRVGVIRLTADGKGLDPTFSANGMLAFGGSLADVGSPDGVAVDSLGRILITGGEDGLFAPGSNNYLVRLTPAGDLDTSFNAAGTPGVFLTSLDGGSTSNAVAVRPDGGYVMSTFAHLFGVTPDGTPDQQFGSAGVADLGFTPRGRAELVIAPAAAGGPPAIWYASTLDTQPASSNYTTRLVRFTAAGQPDAAFGTGGGVTIDVPVGDVPSAQATSFGGLAVGPDGSAVVAGTAEGYSTSSTTPLAHVFVARITPAGRFDASFDDDGIELIRLGTNVLATSGVALDPAGGVITLVFRRPSGQPSQVAVVRSLPADGALDPDFFVSGEPRWTTFQAAGLPTDVGALAVPLAPFIQQAGGVSRVVVAAAVGAGNFTTHAGFACFDLGTASPPVVTPPRTVPLPPALPRGRTDLPVYAVNAGGGQVRVYSSAGLLFTVTPFPGFSGVVHTALADFNADGYLDVACTPGDGGGARVKVYSGRETGVAARPQEDPFGTLNVIELADFMAYGDDATANRGYRGGLTVAAGDVTGDGIPDVVVGRGPGGGPQVRVIDGSKLPTIGANGDAAAVATFFAYESGVRNGLTVAVGDVDGDGRADGVTGAGPGGAPHVKAFGGAAVVAGVAAPGVGEVASFFAYDVAFGGGVVVAVGNLDGAGAAELLTAPGVGGGPDARAFGLIAGSGFTVIAGATAGDPDNRGGLSLAAHDLDGDGAEELLLGTGAGQPARVVVLDGTDLGDRTGRVVTTTPFISGVLHLADSIGNPRFSFLSSSFGEQMAFTNIGTIDQELRLSFSLGEEDTTKVKFAPSESNAVVRFDGAVLPMTISATPSDSEFSVRLMRLDNGEYLNGYLAVGTIEYNLTFVINNDVCTVTGLIVFANVLVTDSYFPSGHIYRVKFDPPHLVPQRTLPEQARLDLTGLGGVYVG